VASRCEVTWFDRSQYPVPDGALQHGDVNSVDGRVAVVVWTQLSQWNDLGRRSTRAGTAVFEGRVPLGLQPAAELDATTLTDDVVRLTGVDEAGLSQLQPGYGPPGWKWAAGERRQSTQVLQFSSLDT